MNSIVIMGVAGCGKSSLGVAVAQQLGLPIVEGDDHHSAGSQIAQYEPAHKDDDT